MATRSRSQKQEDSPRPTTSQATPNVASNSPNGGTTTIKFLFKIKISNNIQFFWFW